MKRDFKQKNDLDEVLSEFSLENIEPTLSFEKRLKNDFINAAQQKAPRMFTFWRTAWIFSVFLIVFVIGFSGLFNSGNRSVAANTFEKIYKNSSNSSLMPVFAKIKNLKNSELINAMNISDIPLDKSNYGTSTTTTINYGEAYDYCGEIFKFDKSISKTTTFEFFDNNIYKFKTHVFDSSGKEVDILIFDGNKYYSPIKDTDFESGVLNFENINKYIPEDLSIVNNNELTWEDVINCSGNEEKLLNITKFNNQNQIESFEIQIASNKNVIYKADFEIKPMTLEELKLVDKLF